MADLNVRSLKKFELCGLPQKIQRRKKMNNRQNFEVKTLDLYQFDDDISISDINLGDYVVAKITSIEKDKVLLNVGQIDAIMMIEDYDIVSWNRMMKSLYSLINKNIYARVSAINGNTVILERKTVVKQTIGFFIKNIGNIFDVTITSIKNYGVFVDIGNGVTSFVHCINLSNSRYYGLDSFFKVGDKIKVKILDYDPGKSFFTLSRKAAYDCVDLPDNHYFLVTVTGYVDPIKCDAFFVEYNPQTIGIVDLNENAEFIPINAGDQIAVFIKRTTDKGFKSQFIHKVI